MAAGVGVRRALRFDKDKCTGCRYCEVVCHLRHSSTCSTVGSRIRLVSQDREMTHLAQFCRQCRKPVCQDLCPEGAIIRLAETGRVVVDWDKCTACWACLECPFQGMSADREAGVAVNCDLCGGEPACVKFCSAGALSYAPLEKVRRSRAE